MNYPALKLLQRKEPFKNFHFVLIDRFVSPPFLGDDAFPDLLGLAGRPGRLGPGAAGLGSRAQAACCSPRPGGTAGNTGRRAGRGGPSGLCGARHWRRLRHKI
jgi:hypothetical protein